MFLPVGYIENGGHENGTKDVEKRIGTRLFLRHWRGQADGNNFWHGHEWSVIWFSRIFSDLNFADDLAHFS